VLFGQDVCSSNTCYSSTDDQDIQRMRYHNRSTMRS
jgi:hypothetical protein